MKSLRERLSERKIGCPEGMNRKDRRKLMKAQWKVLKREVIKGDKVLVEE